MKFDAPTMLEITYIHITGTIGGKEINLKLSIPVEDLIAKTPQALAIVEKFMPTIVKAAEAVTKVVAELQS